MRPGKFYTALLISAIFVVLCYGCKKDETYDTGIIINTPDEVIHPLRADITGGLLKINDLSAGISPAGRLNYYTKNSGTFFHAGSSGSSISEAELWLGVDDPIPPEICNYNYSCIWNNTEYGVYDIKPSDLVDVKALGLTSLGFPADKDGQPKLYGDEMLWLFQKGITGSTAQTSNPVKNVNISMSVFAYKRYDLSNVLFIRYDFKNTGSTDIQKMFAGYRSDTDVISGFDNSTGYLASHGFTYTYKKDGYYFHDEDSTYKQVVGFTFLLSPLEDPGIPFGISSHRIARKNNYINPEFGEYNVGLNEAMYALKGLSNNGTPMIDPMTKQPTMYAFTGDPVTGTGWLDTQVDTRNMINTGHFSLKANETKSLVVLWVCTAEKTLGESLNKVKLQLEKIRSERTLWE